MRKEVALFVRITSFFAKTYIKSDSARFTIAASMALETSLPDSAVYYTRQPNPNTTHNPHIIAQPLPSFLWHSRTFFLYFPRERNGVRNAL